MAWYNAGYLYKKAITQDHTKVSTANQSNFSIEISRTDANLKTVGNGGHVQSALGFDIIFVDSTETTKLDHEIEKYVASTGEIVMHVRIPTLSNSVDTTIYMYYGNSSISTSQENINGVWDSNYKLVAHLKETTGTNPADSTSTGNTLTQTASPTQSTGQIDGSLSFNGSSQYLSKSSPSGINFAHTDAWSISFWAKPTSGQTGIMYAVSHMENSGNFKGYGVILNYQEGVGNAAGIISVQLSNVWTTNALEVRTTSATNLNNGSWHFYEITYDGSRTPGGIKIYEDGTSLGLTTSINALSATTAIAVDFNVASRQGSLPFNGLLDEVRVSNTVRSAGWVATEYNNQSSPSTFYSVGSEVIQTVSLSVTFAGAGTLSGTTSLSTALSATLAGAGTLAPTLSAALALPSTTLAGAGTISATPALSTSLSATLAGIGVIIPALSAQKDLGSATLAGQSSLSATPSLSTALTASLDGQGTLSAVLSAAMALSASLDGTSSLTANPSLGTALATTLAGTGTLDVSGMGLGTALSAEFDGVGELAGTLSASDTVNLAVTMEGTGSLSGTLSLATNLATSLDGLGALAASLSASTVLSATLNGTSTLTASPSLSTALTASLNGVGELSATTSLATSLSANFTGQGSLVATLSTDNTASLAVTMAGQGALSASPDFSLALGAVSLDGTSSLTANAAFITSIAVAMAGQGALSGVASLSTALAVSLAGISTLSASLSVPIALSVIFAGHSALVAHLSGGVVEIGAPNITLYIRDGNATLYTRDGNITLYTRGD